MTFKKIEINDLHPANPLVEVIGAINENFDTLHDSLQNVGGGGVIGPAGPKGDAGQDGREGPQGLQGLQGEQGPVGENGKDGSNGVDGLPGATGAQGPAGIQGIPGERGAQGIQGPVGPVGPQGVAGVGLKGLASGYVDAGQFITLDNIKATVTTTGNRGLSVATVSGTMVLAISASYSVTGGGNGHSTAWPGATYTTTPSGSWFGYHFPNAGDGSTYLCNDYTNQRFYRIHLMIGPGYSKNFISIERLY